MLHVTVLFVFVTVCLYTDLTERKIYNTVVLCGACAALLLNMLRFGATEGFYYTLTGLFTGFLLLIIPFILGGLGAGDVKMLGMIGAFTGHMLVVQVMLASALAGGVFALVKMIIKRQLAWRMRRLLTGAFLALVTGKTFYLANLSDEQESPGAIPYGAALFAGVVIIYILGSTNRLYPAAALRLL